MKIEYNEPFYRTRTDEERAGDKRETFNVSMNPDDMHLLKACMKHIQQDQKSKALKQIFKIGATNVLADPKMLLHRDILFKNIKNNQRRGIQEVE